MRRSLIFMVVTSLCAARAAELPPPSWPPSRNGILPRAEYVLQGDTTLSYDGLSFEDGTIITTQGYDFDLEIRQSLEIKGTLIIRSFPDDRLPPQPAAAGTGRRGHPHFGAPGPYPAADAADREDGMAGGTGERGPTGIPGADGFDARAVTLRFGPAATMTGKLVIRNVGGTGGTGGPGGIGGPGGNGQRGGKCAPDPGRGPAWPSFDDLPGRGGPAGQGGPGGFGGRGGDGGRGGMIVIQARSKGAHEWLITVELSVAGGEPGKIGPGGSGGNAGQPGPGGPAGELCSSKVERIGAQGTYGPGETKGMEGAQKGPDGIIKVLSD
ncbi:hypothetical protein BB934_45820 (plasmid) [Microvirga ossetica]|uniref:Collagen-like protein n=1 Tax=Microvirga ossetica TaxID=1882682 RepID=A0A1B2EZX0_9HYPH|nr:hypothetical protein [Microvirga ossetica]ANY85540.1 hypothetical protein BB934_45820 [Microvirga ossetica]